MTRGEHGFTLIELVAVLILVAMLFLVVLPAFSRGTNGIEARLCRDQIVRDIGAARAEAVGKLRKTSLCFSETSYILDLGFGEPVLRSLPTGFFLAVEGLDAQATPEGPGQSTPSPTPYRRISRGDDEAAADDGEKFSLIFGPNGLNAGARVIMTAPSGKAYALSIQEDGSIAWE